MFTAKFIGSFGFPAPFTKGKEYTVVDFNDYFGTYTVLDDNGERKAIDWMRFEDQGRKTTEYWAALEIAA